MNQIITPLSKSLPLMLRLVLSALIHSYCFRKKSELHFFSAVILFQIRCKTVIEIQQRALGRVQTPTFFAEVKKKKWN